MPANPKLVRDLFLAAADMPSADRESYLTDRCGDDAVLRAAVERLLAAHEAPAPIFESAPVPGVESVVAATLPDTKAPVSESPAPPETATGEHRPDRSAPGTASIRAAEAAGTTIAGRYKLLQQIGEGGMGSVWMADQTEPVRRRVAVKLIRAERGQSKPILSRFEAERQAIALMNHPHIARLLDAGTTADGSPYFVMELVKGIPLNDYCDEHKLGIRDRLQLFTQICSAVQHAHQKGVIHRDLKPTNILVECHDGKPVPKVIDFGLAKATSGLQLSEKTLFTAFGSVMGTPLYMAPEQASFNAVDVDTRADVYALGVILYELLTGTTPITRESMKKAALDEMLRLIREQEAPTPSSRLSTIDPSPSIAANRQMEPQKLGRFVKGELDWIVMKALSKERDRRYETATGLARDIERFLSNEPVAAGPPGARYRLRKFVKCNLGQVIAASLVLLALLAGIAGTTWGLIRAERSAEAERRARAAAQADRQRAVRAASSEKAGREQVQKRLAQIEKSNEIIAAIFADLDISQEKAGAEPLEVVLAKRLVKAAGQIEGEAVGDPLVVAGLQNRLGVSLLSLGHPQAAIPLFIKARETRLTRLGADHPDTLESMNNLAGAYLDAGKLELTLPLFEETLKYRKARLGANHPETLASMNNLAAGYGAAGKPELALPLLEEALKQQKARLGPDHPDTFTTMNNLALGYQAVGKLDRALSVFEETLRFQKAKLGADHPDTLESMNNLARGYATAGKPDLTLSLLQQAAAGIEKRHFQQEYADRIIPNLIACHEALQQFEQAEAWRRKWLAVVKERSGADSLPYAEELAALGLNLLQQKKWADAETVLRECLPLREKKQPDDWQFFETQSMLGGALLSQRKYADAEPLLLSGYEGMKQREKTIPEPGKPRVTDALDRLIELYTALDKSDAVKKWQAARAKTPAPPPQKEPR